jgi:hypothetical protein
MVEVEQPAARSPSGATLRGTAAPQRHFSGERDKGGDAASAAALAIAGLRAPSIALHRQHGSLPLVSDMHGLLGPPSVLEASTKQTRIAAGANIVCGNAKSPSAPEVPIVFAGAQVGKMKCGREDSPRTCRSLPMSTPRGSRWGDG